MNNDNGKIWYGIGLDNSQLEKDIRKSQAAFKGLGDQVTSEASRIDKAFSGIARSVASLGAAWSLQELARKVVEVRGEFQKLEVAMETMLGSKSKAEALMAQMIQTAATTPFGLNDVANGAKQLLAYGVAAEDVNETLIRLGDIAAGLSIPLNDLVYLYGTTMAQGRLYTQDLNQFMGRGIPIAGELAKQFGVAEGKVRSLVEAGEIGFENVKAAIESLTNEGGRFGGLMEAQSKTISGQIANIEDAFDMMLNDIGQSNEGLINDALGATSMLVENYKVVADVLLTAVASYGVYKATLMGVTAYTNACYNYEITQLKTLVAEKGMEVDADLAAAVSKSRMTSARAAEVQALRQELAAKIEAARATAVVAASEASEATRKRMLAQLAYQKARAEVEAKQEEIFAMEGMYAHQTAETLQKEKDVLVTKMHAAQEQLDAASKAENAAVTKAATTAQAVNTLTTQRDTLAKKMNVTQTKLLTLCTNGLSKAFKSLKAALASNPLGLIMVAATTVIGAFITMNDAIEDTSEEIERFGESAVKQSRNVETLLAVINNTSSKSKVHKDAVNELVKIYGEYGIKIDDERSKLEQLNILREEAIRLIREEGEERQKANLIASYEEALTESAGNMRATLQKALSEAEWEGSGMLDDYDAKEYQDRAKELAIVIGSIIQGEGDELAKLSGDAYEKRLRQINGKIQQAYKDLGLTIEKNFSAGGHILSFGTDVDEIGILDDYVGRIRGIVQHREQLINSTKKSQSEIKKESETADYGKMSFTDLFDAAYHAKEGVSEALNEIDRRIVEATKTRRGTADMLQEINKDLETAVVGSDDEKRLLSIQRRLQAKQKVFKTTGESARKAAEKSRKEQAGYLRLLDEQSRERARAAEDAELAASEARIEAMAEGAEKERARRMLDYKKELQDIARQAEDLKAARTEAARKAYEANPENKGKTFDAEAYALSGEAREYFGQVDQAATARREAAFKKQMDERIAAVDEERRKWREYYLRYGDLLQQVDAIEAAYDESISAPGATEADRATAAAERTEQLRRVYAEAAEGSSLIAEAMQETATKSVSGIQSIIDRIRTLLAYLAAVKDGEGTAVVGGRQITRPEAASLAGGEGALSGLENSAEGVKALGEALEKLDSELGSRSPVLKFEQQIKQAGQLFREGGKENIATGIGAIGTAASEFAPALDEFGQSLGTLLGDGIGNAVSGVAATVGGLGTAAAGVGQIMAGDVAGGILSCVNAASQLSGALEGMFGADYSEYNQLKAEYDGLIEVWDQLLERKRAYIEESYGPEAERAGREALELLGKQEQATRELARERLGAGSSAGSHSIGYRMWEGSYSFNGQTWDDVAGAINRALGTGIRGMSDFTNLTSEQLEWIKENYSGLWSHMDHEFRAHLENLIEYGDEAEQISESIREQLTDMSFDSLYDSFVDTLMDMDASAEDIAGNVSEYFMRAMLSNQVGALYRDRLQEWYDDFARRMEDGRLDEADIAILNEGYASIAEEAAALRDQLAEAAGYDGTGSGNTSSRDGAATGGFATASQDSVDELNGRFTAVQMDTSAIRELMVSINGDFSSVRLSANEIRQHTDEIRNLSLLAIDHLETISRNTHELYSINERLGKIERNTRNL